MCSGSIGGLGRYGLTHPAHNISLPSLEPSTDDCYVVAGHPAGKTMNISIEYEQEEDGRWLAEVPQLPGVLVYGKTTEEAKIKVETLALQVIAELL
jgi:predicted RNase H-like HicB family nuclease